MCSTTAPISFRISNYDKVLIDGTIGLTALKRFCLESNGHIMQYVCRLGYPVIRIMSWLLDDVDVMQFFNDVFKFTQISNREANVS
jgi:hypothetical protein